MIFQRTSEEPCSTENEDNVFMVYQNSAEQFIYLIGLSHRFITSDYLLQSFVSLKVAINRLWINFCAF